MFRERQLVTKKAYLHNPLHNAARRINRIKPRRWMEVTNLPLDDGWHAFGNDGGTNLFFVIYDWRFYLPKTDHRRGGVAPCTLGGMNQHKYNNNGVCKTPVGS